MLLAPLVVDLVGFGGFLACVLAVAALLREFRVLVQRPSSGVGVSVCLAVGILTLQYGNVLHFDIPDSAEYFGIASRLLHDGTFSLHLHGRDVPSRYQPWFSWFLIYPFLRIAGAAWVVAILPPIFAVLGVCAASALAASILSERRRAFAWGAGAAVIFVPAYLYFSGHLMTDVPAMVITVLLAAVFCASGVRELSRGRLWAVGFLGALVCSVRPMSAVVLLPFIFESRRTLVRLIPLLLPSAALFVCSLWVNSVATGDPFRSGYHLWVAVPYDYLGLTFSVKHVSANVEILLKDPVFLLFTVVGLCPLSKEVRARLGLETRESRAMLFVMLGVVPQLLLHLFYFYSTIRFFLAFEVISGVLVACRVASLLSERMFSRIVLLLAVIVVIRTLPDSISRMGVSGLERLQKLHRCMPNDGILVSGEHPVLNEELVVRGSARTLVPVSRNTELVSKVLVWSKIEAPRGVEIDPRDHRATWLLEAGAEEAYPHVAVEEPQVLRDAISNGTVVVLDPERVSSAEVEALKRSFRLEPMCSEFQRLTPHFLPE